MEEYGNAHRYLNAVRKTPGCQKIRRLRLMGDLLEEAFEIVCGERKAFESVCQGQEAFEIACRGQETLETACREPGAEETKALWEWAKAELAARTNRYGNLYKKGIAAAEAMGDPYAAQLEKEYEAWRKDMLAGISSSDLRQQLEKKL